MLYTLTCVNCDCVFTANIEPYSFKKQGRKFCSKKCQFDHWSKVRFSEESVKQRIKNKIQIDSINECWLWTGHTDDDGYGKIHWRGKLNSVHRLTYLLYKGEIPKNTEIDHLCRNTRCCNPEHLEPVSHRTNIIRGISPPAIHLTAKTCKRGHPKTVENTYVHPTDTNIRCCRICVRENNRRRLDNKKQASSSF